MLPLGGRRTDRRRLIRKYGDRILQYGGTPGIDALKETVLSMAASRGIQAAPDEVIITSGSTQGIGLAAKTLLNPGDTILTESPTFIGALQTFLSYEADVVGVEMDEQGMIVDALEEKITRHHPKFVYTIPTFQNPTGRTMPVERRLQMLEICQKHGVLIVEDDPYCDLRYSGCPEPPIKSMDSGSAVIYLMSFSKIISPGLRVGAAIADPRIIGKYGIAKQGEDLHTSNLSQEIVNAYMRSGKAEPHIRGDLRQLPRPSAMRCLLKLEELPAGRHVHPARWRAVHLGGAARKRGRRSDVQNLRGQGRGIRTRHPLSIPKVRPQEHDAIKFLYAVAGENRQGHGYPEGRYRRSSLILSCNAYAGFTTGFFI